MQKQAPSPHQADTHPARSQENIVCTTVCALQNFIVSTVREKNRFIVDVHNEVFHFCSRNSVTFY
jgi:hypothetical protein